MTTNGHGRRDVDALIAAALASGASYEEAGKAARVSKSTVKRRLADPQFRTPDYMRPALRAAKITKPFRAWHGLRHTALTHGAAENPQAWVTMRAGHAQASITDRYVHAAQVAFPGAADRAEDRIFSAVGDPVPNAVPSPPSSDPAEDAETASVQGVPLLPGLDSNQQPSG